MSVPLITDRLSTPSRRLWPALRAEEWSVLRWILPLALIHGLIYIVIVPPWEHYDEPGHFLFAAEIAAGERQTRGAASEFISREIADSMVRHQFFDGRYQPDFLTPGPIRVAEDQRVHPPLYYALVAVPLRLVRFLSVDTQLYTARVVSLGLYTLTVLAAWRVAVTLVPDEPAVQFALPVLLLLTPTFTDLMTAVNNDVLLNLAATTTLLGSVLLVRDGVRLLPLTMALLGLVVAVLSKRTGLVLVPLVGLGLFWAVRRTRVSFWLLPLVAIAGLTLLGVVMLQLTVVAGPGGEHIILTARQWLVAFDSAYLRLNLDAWVRSVSDPSLIGRRYEILVMVAFTSFWARLGWGEISLGVGWDWLFAALAVAATVGLGRGVVIAHNSLPLWQSRCLLLFGVSVVLGWVALFARLHPLPPVDASIYVPTGRYMFWTVVPVLWLLMLGLHWLMPARWQRFVPRMLIVLFGVFALAALVATVLAHT